MKLTLIKQLLALSTLALGLVACGGGGDSTSTQTQTSTTTTTNASSTNTQTATINPEVINLDSSVELHSVTEADTDTNTGTLKIAYDSLDTSSIRDKIVVIPADENTLDDTVIKVSSVTPLNEYDDSGKQLAEVEYTVPAIDEIFDKIDFELPDDALENGEITHVFYPESFEQTVDSNLAGRMAHRDGATLNWFPAVDLRSVFTYRVDQEDKKDGTQGATLDIAEVTLLSYGVPGESPLGEIKLSGNWDLEINKIQSSFVDEGLDNLNQSLALDIVDRSNLTFTVEGDFGVDLFDSLSKAKYRCGVSKLSTGEIFNKQFSLTGAKWNDNVCIGGVRLFASGKPFLFGNGADKKVAFSVDIFFTMNTKLEVSAQGRIQVSRNSRSVRSMSLQDGVLTSSNVQYDPDADGLVAIDQTEENDSRIKVERELTLEGTFKKQMGLAMGVNILGVYPFVLEGWGEMALQAEVGVNPFAILPGGDAFLCFSGGIETNLRWRAAVGLSTEVKTVKPPNTKATVWGAGVNHAYESTVWELPETLGFNSCKKDKYALSLTLDDSQSGALVLSNVALNNTQTAQGVTIAKTFLIVYDASGNVVHQQAGISDGLVIDDLAAGSYRVLIGVESSEGDFVTKESTVAVTQSIGIPQNLQLSIASGKIALSWNATPNATGYSVCHSDAPIVSFEDCATRLVSIWEPVLTNQLEVNQLPDGTLLVEGQTYYFGLVAQDADGNISEMSAAVSVLYQVATTSVVNGKLNDTGITQCADASTNGLSCPISNYPNQDAQYGRDVDNNDGSDGHSGFSFTKLDANGNPLLANATSWSCVKDNVTGLIWEVKQGGNGTVGDEGLHDADDRYNWYSTDSANNGGFVGYENDDGAICHGYNGSNASSYCNTQAFVDRVNQAGFCGANDWRLPAREALRSIVIYDLVNPTIDTDYFPMTKSSWYWSSSPSAGYGSSAWNVIFNGGNGSTSTKYSGWYVRLVRGGQ